FFDDPIGEEIEGVLKARARAGVAVRVLLNVERPDRGDPFRTGEVEMMLKDPSFDRDPTDVTAMRKRLEDAGVEVLDTEIDYSKIVETGESEIDAIAREIKACVRVNALHVDHRKIVTIDGRVAYCGSANFGAQYQHHRALDPATRAEDEADRAREAGEPEPWCRGDDRARARQGLSRTLAARWRRGLLLPRGRDPRCAARRARRRSHGPEERAERAYERDPRRLLREDRGRGADDLHREPVFLSPGDRGGAPLGEEGAPRAVRDADRAGARLEPEQVHPRRAGAQLRRVPRWRDRGVRVPEPLQPPEARDVRREVDDGGLREPELPEPRGRQGLRGVRAHRERGVRAPRRRGSPRRGREVVQARRSRRRARRDAACAANARTGPTHADDDRGARAVASARWTRASRSLDLVGRGSRSRCADEKLASTDPEIDSQPGRA